MKPEDKAVVQQALEAMEKVTTELLAIRDELAERGGRPITNVFHQRLWDSSFDAYANHAMPVAAALRQLLEADLVQAEPVAWWIVSKTTDEKFVSTRPNDWNDINWDKHLLYTIQPAQPAPVQEPYCYVYIEDGEEYFAPKGAYVPDNAQPLYTTPPAQPAPVQEPEPACWQGDDCCPNRNACCDAQHCLYTTPPAQPDDHGDELTIAYLDGVHTGKQIAKREWVGLTDEDILEALDLVGYDSMAFAHAYAIEAKLREKNGGGT